eukprot:TRINITY_DN11169_c0_g1_i1.p1 TRINITY_DN11169_c0_g1~~TRINITY_DN11169_c0_g1_i1.p1  ORF type:complete len:121 (+),score=10.76 TRINITY_DN11169_c0_g1_i1:555-917(+)
MQVAEERGRGKERGTYLVMELPSSISLLPLLFLFLSFFLLVCLIGMGRGNTLFNAFIQCQFNAQFSPFFINARLIPSFPHFNQCLFNVLCFPLLFPVLHFFPLLFFITFYSMLFYFSNRT